MTNKLIKKREGFEGQKAIVIPRKVIQQTCSNNQIISDLFITDIGYYPKAKFHYRKRPHGAEENILIYCLEGKGNVTINKQHYQIESGNFFIVPQHIEHFYGADSDDPWTIYWVHFCGIRADNIVTHLVEKAKGYKDFIYYTDNRIELFNTLYTQLGRGYGAGNMLYVNLCFAHFLASFIYQEALNTQPLDHEQTIVDRAINYMKTKLSTICTLNEIAGAINISSSHLSFLFKQKTGYPPIEYMNHLKLQMACQFLMFTDKRVNEVAAEIGMEDQYYFSRFFKKNVGVSPQAYREKIKKTSSR